MTQLAAERSGLVDAFLDSYICWREACEDVWGPYRRRAECKPQRRRLGFAAYQSVLEREEHAASIHCQWAARVSTRATSCRPPPLIPDAQVAEPERASFNVAAGASPYATQACVDTWLTDFRDDLPKIDVPTLVLHGTEDTILPYESTAGRLSELIDEVQVIPVEQGPHNIG